MIILYIFSSWKFYNDPNKLSIFYKQFSINTNFPNLLLLIIYPNYIINYLISKFKYFFQLKFFYRYQFFWNKCNSLYTRLSRISKNLDFYDSSISLKTNSKLLDPTMKHLACQTLHFSPILNNFYTVWCCCAEN